MSTKQSSTKKAAAGSTKPATKAPVKDKVVRDAEKANAVRRERYHSDPAYREEAAGRARDFYREKVGALQVAPATVTGSDVAGCGETRELSGGKSAVCFVSDEAATVIGTSKSALLRWIRAGVFPDFNDTAKVSRGVGNNGTRIVDAPVYTLSVMKALAEVMAEHFAEVSYYRESHELTRNKLFAAVRK